MKRKGHIMKKYLTIALTVIITLTLSVLGFIFNSPSLTQNQLDTLLILAIVCGSSILYCFIVGEIANNNSQMDKLWSILPIAYTWIVAVKGGFNPRLVVYAIIVTLWGIRLTINFARKGAYRLKFWEGEEDYRWAILRKNKLFKSRFMWALFDLFFICIYQNVLVLAICLPALACMESTASFGVFDYIAATSATLFLLLEAIADEQQWKFHQNKKRYINEGKSLEELPEPYDLGFNTFGLWRVMRHPNYLGEQAIWLCLYIFVIGSGNAVYGIFNWSMVGPLFLVLLFLGSSTFGESISASKYLRYSDYQKQVFKYLPLRRFNPNK